MADPIVERGARREGLAATGVLVLLLAAVYWPMFGGAILFLRDLGHWVVPAQAFVRAAREAGWPPTWNPDQALGFPVLGDPLYGLFYPPHLLFRLGSPVRLVTVVWWLHMVAGGVGSLLLARRLGAGGPGSVVAGVAWSLAGPTTSAWGAGVLLEPGAWLPWCGLGLVALARAGESGATLGGRARPIALAALPIGLAILTGEVFVALMAAGFGVALGLVALATRRPRPPDLRRRVLLFVAGAGLAFVLGTGLGAVTVIPAARVAGSTERAAPLARAVAERCSLHPFRLIELAAPQAFGDPYGRYPTVAALGKDCLEGQPLTESLYAGGAVLALVLLAFGRSRSAATGVGVVAAFGLLLAMGRHTPLHQLVRLAVPPLAYMRHPEKYLVIATGALSLLAALGASRLLEGGRAAWRRTVVLGSLLALAAVLVRAMGPAAVADDLAPGLGRGAAATGLCAAVMGLAGRRPRLAAVLLVLVTTVDLAVAAAPLQQFAEPDLATRVPAAVTAVRQRHPGALAPPRVYRALRVDEALARHVEFRSAVDGERHRIDTLITNTVTTFGLAVVPGYDVAIPRAFGDLWALGQGSGRGVALLRLLGVDAAVLPVDEPAAPPGPRPGLTPLGDPLPGARLFEVQEPLPRVFLAGQATVRPDDQVMREVLDPEVVSGARAVLAPDGGAAPLDGAPGRAGDCRLTRFETTHLEATCRALRPALAVFVEQSAPGWTATVDGRQAPLLRADLLLRAVAIGSGEHRIALDYAAPGLRLGQAVSLIVVAAIAALLVAGRRRSTRPAE